VPWGPFLWFVSLGKQRNERTNFTSQPPGFPKRTFFTRPPHIPFALPKPSGIYRACPSFQLYLQDSTCPIRPWPFSS
jgi:hypothetical protein